nr:unnamed protein product [Callosobruchus analis]
MKSEAEAHMKRIQDKLRSNEEENKCHKAFKQNNLILSGKADTQKDTNDCFSPSCTGRSKNNSDKRVIPDNDLEQWLDDILDD